MNFGRKLKKQPVIFGVNYFLKEVGNGKYVNGVQDKHVWIKWMELRVHNEVDALATPTGYIPKYEDLRKLFKQLLGKNYAKEDYIKQFTIRVPENLAKLNVYHGFIRKTLLTHRWNYSAYCTCNANASSKLKRNTANIFHLKNSKNKK